MSMSSQRPSPAPRRTIPIKRTDGEPLTRADIQYDVLHALFSDSLNVFTDPYAPNSLPAPAPKLCFRELYIKAMVNSSKATKALRDKIHDSALFAEDFAMLALLVNVGRINTTMSFFPEMKTTIRTYHPVPALQRTNGNLQDAPRIKHILKASLLESEANNPPSTPADIVARTVQQVPSTSIINLMFVLANHSLPIGQAHFPDNIDFMDLFIKSDVSSASRARALLWLCYHYLESPAAESAEDDYDSDVIVNPFSDPRKGKAPAFVILTPSEIALENVDTEAEKLLSVKLVSQRQRIITNQGNKGLGKASVAGSAAADEDDEMVGSGEDSKPKPKRGGAKRTSTAAKEKKAAADKLRRERLREEKVKQQQVRVGVGEGSDEDDDVRARSPILQNQYPPSQQSHSLTSSHRQRRASRTRVADDSRDSAPYHRHRYAPYRISPSPAPGHLSHQSHSSHRPRQTPLGPRRTMLQHAWHMVTTSDPLLNSDEEPADEHVRYDYIQRLRVISRLGGKESSPEPEGIIQE